MRNGREERTGGEAVDSLVKFLIIVCQLMRLKGGSQRLGTTYGSVRQDRRRV
jgi:hypothetical protein